MEAKKETATAAPNAAEAANQKSGLRRLASSEVLFHDGDAAQSLYIIQKGQIRLYKPKGKGFIELAVLRAGEVIGEMAFFDEDGSGKRRSCSAQAMVPTEIIEISFHAFAKTMSTLNPWFKTIINTLATRLRKGNARIKELESNSVALNYGGASDYEFLKSSDVIKILCTLFLVFKGHGETKAGATGLTLHRSTLDFYAYETFNIQEAKLEEMINFLKNLNHLTINPDKDNLPKLLQLKDLEQLRQLLIFMNSQKVLVEDKKLKISHKCESFLEKIYEYLLSKNIAAEQSSEVTCPMNPILNQIKEKNLPLSLEDLDDARKAGLVAQAVVEKEGDLTLLVYWDKLKKVMPNIRFQNALSKFNESKKG